MIFLRAEWRNLVMLNYRVDPGILLKQLPNGTELDLWDGEAYASVVGFNFGNTKPFNIPIPFYQDFEEVNLRFYVRRKAEDEWRRGVVFIRELVPRRGVAALANLFYGEHYQAVPMGQAITDSKVEYHWTVGARDHYRLGVTRVGESQALVSGSLEEYIAEHYWGYTLRPNKPTLEYRVEHPSWRVWQVEDAVFDGDAAALYGDEFGEALSVEPHSAFLADGSEVVVHRGVTID